MSRTALFVSPHLDDAVFSCGGTMALLAAQGWRTILLTCFTQTIHPATGFALACQLDKGLGPEIDYMALRRDEDRDAAAILDVAEIRNLPLPEAPHRGYAAAPALFGDIRAEDAIWRELTDHLATAKDELRPDQVFAPQGLGAHVDHRQTIRAVQAVFSGNVAWYRDTPYAIRNPDAVPFVEAGETHTVSMDEETLDRKIRAACAYRSQIGFQFGGPEAVGIALAHFAAREGGERFTGNLDVGRISGHVQP